jgi:DNA polymerase V
MSATILGPLTEGGTKLPLYSFKVPAGFPSPAADHIEKHISLDQLLDIRAPHVYLVRIEGRSMEGAGIFDGDLAVVDRSVTPEHGHIVIAALNGDPVCKRLTKRGAEIILVSENVGYPPRYILEGDELSIWGVVTFSVRSHDPKA